MKLEVESVFSATRMMYLKIPKNDTTHSNFKQKLIVMKESVKYFTDYINKTSKHFNPKFSLLCNGYTEASFFKKYLEDDLYGFDSLYADSGGLQMITENVEITTDVKEKIYQTQDLSKVSFCIDEIPVELKNKNAGFSKQSRTVISEKHFDYSRFKECAKNTALNVKHQIQHLKKSKVSYIIQGNTVDDMVEWFDIAATILGDDIEKLYGIAPAGTCMGNGQLESCDMMCAAKIIFEKYPKLKRHMHFLGVGSAARFFPTVMMMNSGFIPVDTTLSFDSSSFSMSYVMANFKLENGKTCSGEDEIYKSFIQYLTFMRPVYSKYVNGYDVHELARLMIENSRLAPMLETTTIDKSHKYHNIGGAIVPMYCLWCNYSFFNQLSNFIENRNEVVRYIYELKDVTDVEGYEKWRVRYGHLVQSNRMDRKVEYPCISALFE